MKVKKKGKVIYSMNSQIKDWKTNLEELLDRDEATFVSSLGTMRSNKISIDFIGKLPVNTPSKKAKISHLASLRSFSAKDLSITVFDKKDVRAVVKSILDADLGYHVERTVNETIYFSLAFFTEETRVKLIQKCKDNLENAKISFRNSRQKALAEIKISKFSIDQDKRAKKQVDETINSRVSKAVKIYEQKVAELSSL